MGLVEDLLKKVGISEKHAFWVGYLADSVYWIILFYLIATYGYYTNEYCGQAVNEINSKCVIICSESDVGELKYANSSGINITWQNNSGDWIPYG
jgi:hypothetical protein